MTVAAIAPELLPATETLRETVEALARRCMEDGRSPSESLTDADLDGLSEEEARIVLRVGMIDMVNDKLHRWRGTTAGDAGSPSPRTNPMHAASGRNPTFWRGLGIVHHGADNLLKPLLRFTVEDCKNLKGEAEQQRAAWSRRKSWATAAAKALTEHGGESIEDLPAETKTELDEMAVAAWGR